MTPTQQQIKHVSTLHRFHRTRHKRYRESPLAEAIDDLIQIDQAEQDNPPLLKLGPEGRERGAPALTPYVLVLLAGAVLAAVASAAIGWATAPQELGSTDRAMPAGVVGHE